MDKRHIQVVGQAESALSGPPSLGIDPRDEASGQLQLALEKLRELTEGVGMEQSPAFPREVNERIPLAQGHAELNLSKADPECVASMARLLATARCATTSAKRMWWLNRAADAVATGHGPHSACSEGCAHCCHIPVALSRPEAEAIAKATGRAIDPAAKSGALGERSDHGTPCPFLEYSRCSIYDRRPAVCRSHLNLDVDSLLCRPVPGAAVPVPYLNVNAIHVARFELLGTAPYADIRDWFPAP